MKKHLEARVELVIISLVLIVSIFAFFLLNDSAAWFAENDQVESSGLSLSAKSTSNLIISNNVNEIRAGVLNFNVNFGTQRENMIPVTRDTDLNPTAPHLVYITNHYNVNSVTGLGTTPDALGFTPVPTTDNESYFIEHEVYLASVVDSIAVTALTATITVPDQKYLTDIYINAASVDFYVLDTETDDYVYRGTTSVSDSVNATSNKSIDLFDEEDENKVIPKNTDGYITVLMRFYFDGALTYSESEIEKAYINSSTVTVNSDMIYLGVQFDAVE